MPKGIKRTCLNDFIKVFWGNVTKNGIVHPVHGQCWEWEAGKDSDGYGIYTTNTTTKAHRFSYIIHYGVIPPTLCVLHKCDNRKCVNPDHLFLGTNLDNIKDMDSKGRRGKAYGERNGSKTHPERVAKGDRNGSRTHPERLRRGDNHWTKTNPENLSKGEDHTSKLTDKQVIEIRKLYALGYSQCKLARIYKVKQTNISLIVNRKTWKHL